MAERGRPRGFDEEEVLDVAMRLFWEHGFDGTSMSELTEAMGINRRSVYAAFGNKEALFTAALERYLAGPGAFVEKARRSRPPGRLRRPSFEAPWRRSRHRTVRPGAWRCSPP